jgi:hypothetical protein
VRTSRMQEIGAHRQRGVVMILVVISMVALLGMTGLALDGAHAMLTKSRLQSAVDASALGAAKILDIHGGSQAVARAEALLLLGINAAGAGNGEIAASMAAGNLQVTVEFSNNPLSFNPPLPASEPAEYVRVIATNLRLRGWFIPVLGVAEKVVGASAVAGPSPSLEEICNVTPLMACGDPNASDEFFGYRDRTLTVLKFSSNSSEVGPGNFYLVRLTEGSGAEAVRRALAGSHDACIRDAQDAIGTEPGNTVGPVSQGLNTRFGIYTGPMGGTQSEYPPDVIVRSVSPGLDFDSSTNQILYRGSVVDPEDIPEGLYHYDDYLADIAAANYTNNPSTGNPPGAFERRTLVVPVGDCSGRQSGQSELPLLGLLCFHLLQPAVQHGNESHVYGQFIGEGCGTQGNVGPMPGTGPGPYRIQLYKDPDAVAS